MAKQQKKNQDYSIKGVYKSLPKKARMWVCITLVIIIVIGLAIGAYMYYVYDKNRRDSINNNLSIGNIQDINNSDLSIHIMELGNNFVGDAIYIKAGNNDILVDAGSRANSVDTITTYMNNYVKDNKLEYVIATHGDQDHIAGFARQSRSIFDKFKVGTIIDFPRTTKDTNVVKNYFANRDKMVAKGTTHYTALECYNNIGDAKRVITLSDTIQLHFLYNYFYENHSGEPGNNDENNMSVCFYISEKTSSNKYNNYLFTGDLEKDGEHHLVMRNELPECVFFKAGHHGSYTSSTNDLLKVIKPKLCAVSCIAGSIEYTVDASRTFPSQDFIDRISIYTSMVFVPMAMNVGMVGGNLKNTDAYSLNGNVIVYSKDDIAYMVGTNNSTLLKDTDWFKDNRTMPQAWAAL